MTPIAVTAGLLHELVSSCHAEGITAIAVACTVEVDGRVLLIVEEGLDFIDDTWQLPTGSVLPGEALTDALAKTLAAIGLDVDEVTGYLGHHDRVDIDGESTRVFCFAVTVTQPDSICRSARTAHQWADLEDLPDLPAPPGRYAPAAAATWAPMSRREPGDPPLAGPLRAGARGLCAAQAGTELFIRHTTWLQRRDFRDRFVHLDNNGITSGTETAAINWCAAISALDSGQLPCSGGEERMLRLAASLVDGISVNLRDTLTGLDSRNTGLVSQAVLHINSRHQQPPHREGPTILY